uniref:DUF5641 domain-containing protein n=1 Tax=Caenorhabditis japonica TaxID=281687 RepID=A0A8R1IB83_CAEJA
MPSVQTTFPDEFTSMRERVLDSIKMGTTEKLTRIYIRGLDRALTDLWNIFQKEYFANLQQEQPKSKHHTTVQPMPGHIVHVKTNTLLPRNHWPLGRIMSLNKSKDNTIRSAVVKCGKELLERSINQLVPLECPELHEDKSINPETLSHVPQPILPPIRPTGDTSEQMPREEVLSCSKDNTTSLAYKTNFPTTSTEVAGAPSKQMVSQSPTPV